MVFVLEHVDDCPERAKQSKGVSYVEDCSVETLFDRVVSAGSRL